ncbi:multidrug ABC transporter ATP-binding protein [Longispora fulva]|uniref:Putative ABC transport system ATP-binding protein n=1 Tax=Longispora fulva TaxID=619741 RepID=A0A8J7KNH4_9ACTN|nr:ABC transporter ATP-binding protein [Longispora fulva]MBG6135252.1 putative ABC transport system ATP-binding protein [Longispora fulva]GIG56511.1 multidrug ABC transporter ATP-binding protein [Longispora fulva]
MSAGRLLRSSIGGQARHIATGATLAAAHQAGEVMVPVLIGVVIDRAVATGAGWALLGWLAVLAVVFAALSTSFRLSARSAERANEQAAHELRVAVTARVLHPRGGADTGRLSGALVTLATGDAQRVGAVNGALVWGVAALLGITVSAVALLRISVPLGLLVLLGTPPLLFLAHLIGRPLERRSDVEQDRAAHASGIAADLVAGLRVLKGIGAEAVAVSRYRATSRDSLAATLRAARAQAWNNGAIVTLTGVFIAAVALVGGRLAAAGDISIGGLVAAVGLALFLLTPFETFAWVNGELAQGRASAARIAAVLDAPHTASAGVTDPAAPVEGRVRFWAVTHSALRDLHLDVAPGELLGVVAADPLAASALLECLGRDVDPYAGSVELDGRCLSGLDPAGVRAAILVAAHDADLFEGTVLDNVGGTGPGGGPDAAPSPGADGAPGPAPDPAVRPGGRVRAALAAALADEVAGALPRGLDTPVTERGRSLSGGQRQRVALARALAADPPVLVVHDPTTAVDTVTEARIAAGVRDLREGRTTILVTTSPALLAVTDRVVVLHDGAVTAEGTHPELVRDHPGYRATVLA